MELHAGPICGQTTAGSSDFHVGSPCYKYSPLSYYLYLLSDWGAASQLANW